MWDHLEIIINISWSVVNCSISISPKKSVACLKEVQTYTRLKIVLQFVVWVNIYCDCYTKPNLKQKMFNSSASVLCIFYIINFLMLMQLLTIISSIDDLNYPEKTNTYYIVNAPYIFSACWKVRNFYHKKYYLMTSLPVWYFSFNIALSVEFLLRHQHHV